MEFITDWVLYLMNGQLKCNVSTGKNKIGTDQELLAKGYKISMVQKNKKQPTEEQPNPVCEMEAILSEYEGNKKDGKFMIAGIIGSAKLDKPGEKNYYWKDLNENKECMKDYMEFMKNDKKEYIFKLKVGHYCTCGKEYEILEFDLNFNPTNLAQPGIQEHKNVQIYLDLGILHLLTDSLICMDPKLCQNSTIMKEIHKKFGIKKLAEKAEDDQIVMKSNLELLDENGTMNLLDDESTNGTIIDGNMTNEDEVDGLMLIGNGTFGEGENGNDNKNDGILTILKNNTQN